MRVEDVIRHGRDLHPAFTDLWTPGAALLRFLSRYQQRLLALLADAKRDALRQTDAVALPLADFAAGAALTPFLLIHGGDVVFRDAQRDPEALQVVGFNERLAGRHRWGAYEQGGTLYLLGRPEDWTGVLRIDVYSFPRGSELAGMRSEFVLPGQPLDALVAAAASFLAARAAEDTEPPVDRARLALESREAQELYLDQAAGRRRATVTRTRQVW